MLPIAAATLVLVAYGRWRSDVVAVLALVAALLSGVVAPGDAFAGFASPAVAIVVLLSVLSVAVRNSVVVEALIGALTPVLRWETVRVAVLGLVSAVFAAGLGSGAVLSSVMVATVQGMRRERQRLLPILLPISLLVMLGGLVTAVGTLPNLLLWTLHPAQFRLFGFAPVGVPVAAVALVVVVVVWRLLPRGEDAAAGPSLSQIESYTSEVAVPAGSPLVGQTVGAIEARSEGAVTLKGIVRESFRRIEPRPDWAVEAGDVLVLACEPIVLQRFMERSGLQIVGGAGAITDGERVGVVEAIVTPASELVGRSPDGGNLRGQELSLLAIGRSGRQPPGRLHRTKLQAGDVLLLQGELASMPRVLAGLGCLTLAERRLRLGQRRRAFTPLVVLVAAFTLAAAGTLPLPIALLAAALVLVLGQALTLDEAYAAVPWPVVVLVGAFLPISLAMRDGGAAGAVAGVVAPVLGLLPDVGVLLAVLGLALVLAPLFGGVVAILVLLPLVAAVAARLGLHPEPLLAAAAVGASCEFVTLRRRHGAAGLPGGERGWPAWRLLLPLYCVVLLVGTGAILLHWTLR